MISERLVMVDASSHAARALSLGYVQGLQLTALTRDEVSPASQSLQDGHWFIESPTGIQFGQGGLPADLGESGRAFDQLTEIRWDADEAWRLTLADDSNQPHELLGQGLEEECRDRVLPCAAAAEAPGMAGCPWESVVARRVFSQGRDAMLRFVAVQLVDAGAGHPSGPETGADSA